MENKEKKAADRLIDRIKIIRDRLDQIPHEERWTEAARLAIIDLNGPIIKTNLFQTIYKLFVSLLDKKKVRI